MTKILFKKVQLLLLLATFFVLVSSLYFQYVLGLHPCPLCLMQRLCVFLLLLLMGFGFAASRKTQWICLAQIIIALLGLYFSLRQLWIQSLPEGSAPACMPGLDVLIQYFPLHAIVKELFWGSASCGEITWTWWGISMPGWSALYFFAMTFTGLFLFFHRRKMSA